MTEIRPFLVNGEWRTGEGTLEVRSPFDDAVVAEALHQISSTSTWWRAFTRS